ncbi:putative DNA-binding protein containing a Zn-ribbon domain [Candidatus Nitrososphaera evergladensis SR1]|uniref:tRNA(Ile2) 2-agmatinylcytidine synthetase TiaS n=1 Tax=Candidatus Nitrososphaera evergladensis SR1 TaxID=1459636 RepID=A0A075MLZ5_9ARCH|nr:tRNA(Ile)(2)-agmatinylcytidine synthase [Candidatus Nitrososphaera evergladensis]AIF82155.1 putative DNA-binding protein containing a Zn-ribbon domain [Candidatus Nitrososphaera evergladensis SR1]
MTLLHIAFDDTDSRAGRCTTHLAFRVAGELQKTMGAELVDYPLLIRLNPNIPWKTRGNGAVCLRARLKDAGRAVDYVRQAVEEGSAIGSGANPGMAFLEGEEILPEKLKQFSAFAMCDVSSRQQAEKVAKECGIKFWTFGNGQGLVGALGAMGCALDGDHTFELIAYRTPENCGTPRVVDNDRIIKFSKETFPYTFNNYDQNHGRVLIAPHGPDPVFFGVRGESPEVVSSAMSKILPAEKLEGHMVFRSNQGTNMHLQNELDLRAAKAYTAGHVRCRVKSKPYAMEGGHVMFSVEQSGAEMPAAVYEPTGLANVAVALAPGDLVEIGVGVRKGTTLHPKILNVEYLLVKELAPVYDVANPLCKMCGRRMKSEGRNKGYQCEKCKFRDQKAQKIMVEKVRAIKPGLYVPTPKAHRHLTKPVHRYGMEKTGFQYTTSYVK